MRPYDYLKIREESLLGPRVTSLYQHFEDIAAGIRQIPRKAIVAKDEFINRNPNYGRYHSIFQRNIGTFYKHLCASIPFLIEEHCRLGVALYELGRMKSFQTGDLFTLYETSSADGTNARTLAEYSGYNIKTLTDSPNPSNGINFNKLCLHKHSDIHIGPFVDITPEYLIDRRDRPYFRNGFDIIYENTTFQMYSKKRSDQIAYVRRVLKKDGLMVFLEKLNHDDPIEYTRREQIKDSFKTQYFTPDQIEEKNKSILLEMEKHQVSLKELTEAINLHFSHAYLIWNSANFYEIIASDNFYSLRDFIHLIDKPYVPMPYSCETNMVRRLFGMEVDIPWID